MNKKMQVIYALGFYFLVNSCLGQLSDIEYLYKSFENTYKQNICFYTVAYTKLKSNGDTINYKYNVNLFKDTNYFAMNTLVNDSTLEVYQKEVLLTANLKSQEFELKKLSFKDVVNDAKYLFRPLVDRRFGIILLEDSIKIEKLSNINNVCTFRIDILNPGDLDELSYTIKVTDKDRLIQSYSYQGKFSGIKLFAELELVSYDTCNIKEIDQQKDQSIFYSILRDFQPKCRLQETSEDRDNSPENIHDKLPFYRLISIEGDTLKMSSDSSKYYLVDYWFRSCPPCIKSQPILKQIDLEYDERQLKIISINNVDKSAELIKNFCEDNNMDKNVYTSTHEKGREFTGVYNYPTIVIYDRNYKVIKIINGFSDSLREEIKEVIDQ
jgi:thiol-disulfide isomerase/thioredoxin